MMISEQEDKAKERLLLHACCGPCQTHVIDVLKQSYEITLYFYNPNIHPDVEYRKRLAHAKRYADHVGISLVEAEYDKEIWFTAIKGLEDEPEQGRRCTECFRLRLEKTAAYAKEQNIPVFATTLTISPHKNKDTVNRIGSFAARQYNVRYLESDFKKNNGFRKSIEISREHGLYRQNYCGCIFSMQDMKKREERYEEEKKKDME